MEIAPPVHGPEDLDARICDPVEQQVRPAGKMAQSGADIVPRRSFLRTARRMAGDIVLGEMRPFGDAETGHCPLQPPDHSCSWSSSASVGVNRNATARACWSAGLVPTNRMVGRSAASKMASASAASFFCRSRNGLT